MSEYDAFARYYDLEYRAYTDDSLLYRSLADRAGSPILELACGTGRHLIGLARAGHTITGLDTSEPMLAIAADHLSEESPEVQARVTMVQADMRRFRLDGRFRMAFYAINSFMHLMTALDQARSLRCVHRHLAPGGLLAVDIFNPEMALFDSAGRIFYERTMHDAAGGATVTKMVATAVDRRARTNRLEFHYDEVSSDGRLTRSVAPITQRYLHRAEMERLLARSGFVVEQVYGDFRLQPSTPASPKMIFVATRATATNPALPKETHA
jgi:ubiquinone/menaquinone biosynthesis C-methylase UbiE